MPRKGYKQTEEHRKNSSKAHKGKPTGRKGIKHTESAKKKMSDAKKGLTSPMKGKKHTKEALSKMCGDQICNHHIAYDFNNQKDLTVKVTRRFHGQIHSPKGQGIHERGYILTD